MNNKLYFISRNYKMQFTAAGKGKIDCEKTLERIGFKNLGLRRTTIPNSIIGSILTFCGVLIGLVRLPKRSTICLIYPTKKYYNLILKVAGIKKCKIITIIFDLRSHRKGKLGVKKEIDLLNSNHIIISHNQFMTKWLTDNHLKSDVVNLDIFDYLSKKENLVDKQNNAEKHSIVFAGALGYGKNGFIYDLDSIQPKNYTVNLYGIGYEEKRHKENSIINYKGFFPADEVVNRLEGSFGLVWDGISIEECAGNFGEYLKINNPHKTSLYLRAGLPVIIWDKAAMSTFVSDYNVGIAVSSLRDLDDKLNKLSKESYLKMKENAVKLSEKIGTGHFLEAAIQKCQ